MNCMMCGFESHRVKSDTCWCEKYFCKCPFKPNVRFVTMDGLFKVMTQ